MASFRANSSNTGDSNSSNRRQEKKHESDAAEFLFDSPFFNEDLESDYLNRYDDPLAPEHEEKRVNLTQENICFSHALSWYFLLMIEKLSYECTTVP